MKNLSINLQQTIFFEDDQENAIINSILAVFHESKNLIVFNVSYPNKDLEKVKEQVSKVFPEKELSIICTDGFRIDTWDNKIGEFK